MCDVLGHLELLSRRRSLAKSDALTSCAGFCAAVLFESEESLLRDAVKRRQTADCEQELSARLRQESGYYYQDPFESRRGLRGRSLQRLCCTANALLLLVMPCMKVQPQTVSRAKNAECRMQICPPDTTKPSCTPDMILIVFL